MLDREVCHEVRIGNARLIRLAGSARRLWIRGAKSWRLRLGRTTRALQMHRRP
jgi:hypothetical protein